MSLPPQEQPSYASVVGTVMRHEAELKDHSARLVVVETTPRVMIPRDVRVVLYAVLLAVLYLVANR